MLDYVPHIFVYVCGYTTTVFKLIYLAQRCGSNNYNDGVIHLVLRTEASSVDEEMYPISYQVRFEMKSFS